MTYWVLEEKTESERAITMARLEIPPKGYTGSLAGTSWDPDAMADSYSDGGW